MDKKDKKVIKMSKPFYSIVLPTKNRSWIIDNAFKSILLQNFTDFEFILVDNSDDGETKKLFDKYLSTDKRCRYLKTGGLLMPDNWQAGVDRIKGKYLVLIEDKQALKKNALNELYNLIEKNKFSCIAAYPEFFIDIFKKNYVDKPSQGKDIRIYSSDYILDYFLSNPSISSQFLFPTGFHSVIEKKIVDKANNSKLGRLCHKVSPDVSMGFFQLFYSKEIVRLPEGYSLITTSKSSHGASYMKTKDTSELLKKNTLSDTYKYVPIKTSILVNTIFNDYMRMRKKLGGKFNKHDLNIPEYFTQCRINILNSGKLGADTSYDEKEWIKAFNKLDCNARKIIEEMITARTNTRLENIEVNLIKTFGKKLNLHKVKKYIIDKMNPEQATVYYKNPVEYLENNPLNLDKYKIIEVK